MQSMKKIPAVGCLIFFSVLCSNTLWAQANQSSAILEQRMLLLINPSPPTEVASRKVISGRFFNPINSFYAFYKRFISDQIGAYCAFEPSCSTYSYIAVTRFGFVKGLLLTADRLMRCNGASGLETESHLVNSQTGRIIDTPEMYVRPSN